MTDIKIKLEVIKRMKMMGLSKDVIKYYEETGKLYYSETINDSFAGILYWLDNKPTYLKMVQEFEKKYPVTVYHATLGYYDFGTCLTLFFIEHEKESLDRDVQNLRQHCAYVYVCNLDMPDFSEFGMVMWRSANGGLVRVA